MKTLRIKILMLAACGTTLVNFATRVAGAEDGTPSVPATFTAEVHGWSQATVRWSQVPDGGSYELERRIGTNAWHGIDAFEPGIIEFRDAGLTADTDVAYRMRVRGEPPNHIRWSAYTPIAAVRTAPYTGRIAWSSGRAIPLASDPPGAALRDVAGCGKTWVVVGDGVLWRRDPMTLVWSNLSAKLAPGTVLNGAVCANGEFYVVGAAAGKGSILRSSDGLNWNDVSPVSAPGFYHLAFGNDRFVTLAFETIYYSDNGMSWSNDVVGEFTSMFFRRVVYDNGRFLATGLNPSAGLRRSTDGRQWEFAGQVLQYSGTPTYLNGIASGRVDGRETLIAVGQNYNFVSAESQYWNRNGKGAQAVAFGNGVFVAAKHTGGLMASLDGVHWQDAPVGFLPAGTRYTAVSHVEDQFVAVGLNLVLHAFQAGSATNPAGSSLSSEDFGPSSERISFDNLAVDATVTSQLTLQGVRLRPADGSPVIVGDPVRLRGMPAHSAPWAIRLDVPDLPLEIRFSSLRRQVGFYFGSPGTTNEVRAVLQVFDPGNVLLAQASVEVEATAASSITNFIGVGVPQNSIDHAVVTLEGEPGLTFIDDLLIEPRQSQHPDVIQAVTPLQLTLQSTNATVQQKLDAIGALLLVPSEKASEALQDAARSVPDLYVRERAIMGLTQLRDPGALSTLAGVGQNAPAEALRQAACNAVWDLRRQFPLADPPEITLQAITPIKPGEPFTIEARVVSPVDRAQVQVRFKGDKAMPVTTRNGAPGSFEGPLRSGQEVVLRAQYLAMEEGQSAIQLDARVSQNLVDATTYSMRLYIDVRSEGSLTRLTPFPEWQERIRHIIPNPDAVNPTPKVIRRSGSNGERDTVVNGSVHYQDGDAGNMLAFTAVGAPKPGRLMKVKVVDSADHDEEFGEGWTDSEGVFFVLVEDVPDNLNLDVLLEVDNYITKLYLDTNLDIGGEVFLLTLATINAGTFGTLNVGANVVPVSYVSVAVDENGFWPGGKKTNTVSFAAAMNINEVIRVTRADMDANRDPNQGDSIGQVDVEYGDSAWNHYYHDLVLTAPLIDGLIISNNLAGIDYGWVDKTVAHEYTHHLQYEISSWDAHDGGHNYCVEIESFWWNASEFAFSEGFADYNGDYIARTQPGMSLVQLLPIESGCGPAGSGTQFTSAPRSQEAWFNVEGHIAAFLRDLTDGWGQGTDAWDQVDGAAIGGHRIILQIFDHELDDGWSEEFYNDAPDLREFYQVWRDRFPGLNFAAGQPVVDAVLNGTGLVPGDDSPGHGNSNRPFPVIEGNPLLPSQSNAALVLPDGIIPQYDPPIAVAHVPDQPVLTIRRRWSFIDAIPPQHDDEADRIMIQLGFCNLGAVTLALGGAGSPDTSVFANWSATVVYSPSGVNWLEASPASGRFSSTNAFDLVPLTVTFQRSMQDLAGNQQYTADILLTYQTLTQTETRIIRIVLDQFTGPDDDTDGDGLTNRQERELAQSNRAFWGCLHPRDADSDNDGLTDGQEVNTYGTSPCNSDTDNDGMTDGLEARHPCLNPKAPDAEQDPDMDGLSNRDELLVTFPTDPCDGDTDDDGALDGADNCRHTPNPDQSDLDQDGRGDVCDGDIDGDGCANLYDPNPTDVQNPDEACLARPTDPLLTRAGRLITQIDPRLADSRLQVLLDGLRPDGLNSCGEVRCPPPSVTLLKDNGEVVNTILADALGYDQVSGFASVAELLPDLDGDGVHDLAIGAPRARGGAGDVVIVSSQSGQLLARLPGPTPGGAFGETLALRSLSELAIGAPGSGTAAGAVHLARLTDFIVSTPIQNGAAGDRFGAALLTVDVEGSEWLLIGAPGDQGAGVVFGWTGVGAPSRLASGKLVGDEFGAALVRAGDMTQDGILEVLVGSPGASRGGESLSQVGEVVLMSLNGRVLWSRTGHEAGERFGSALASLSLGNGPVVEFLVGAPGWRNRTGRAYLLTADGEMPMIIPGQREGAELGRYVAAGPDYDGDGFPALVTVEPGEFGPGNKPGRATAFQTFVRPDLGPVKFSRDGQIELSVFSRPGVRYQIEGSDDLIGWQPLRSFTSSNSIMKMTDAAASVEARRFYRLSIFPAR